jgi:alpha 1,6-mannosyltransferase
MLWVDLKDIREPLRVGDVVILPVTGFSPGVGNFGSQKHWREWIQCEHSMTDSCILDKEAMVEHLFRGSWKSVEGNQ